MSNLLTSQNKGLYTNLTRVSLGFPRESREASIELFDDRGNGQAVSMEVIYRKVPQRRINDIYIFLELSSLARYGKFR